MNRQYNRNQGHHDYDNPDKRVMRHIKVEAPTFKGQLDLRREVVLRGVSTLDEAYTLV